MEYVLLVSWLLTAHTQTYQVEFATSDLCQQAQKQVSREADRVLADYMTPLRSAGGSSTTRQLPPVFSAICVKKK